MQRSTAKLIADCVKHYEGKRIVITLDRLSSKRSAQQNRYIHALFTMFAEGLNDLGNEFTASEVKEICKAKFAMIDVVNEDTGEVIGTRVKGTSEMSKTELNEFFEKVIRWAAEMFSITLYYPNEQIQIEA